MLSRKFIIAVKFNKLRVWEIAKLAGIHPSTLSRFLSGALDVNQNDPRLIKVCDAIGFPIQDAIEDNPNRGDKGGGEAE